MKILSERYVPLVLSVGQVVIFPYYILWLKEASLTFTLFTWLFAAFSFSAALGYRLFQAKKNLLIRLFLISTWGWAGYIYWLVI
jgi:hypothetical protein